MTSQDIDKELKQLEKDYWDTLQSMLDADVLMYPAVQEPRGVAVKKLTDAYYARKLELEALLSKLTGGGGDDF